MMMEDDTTREALLDKVRASLSEDAALIIGKLIAENKALKEQVEQLTQHNHTLRLKVDAMARRLFGKSSEKLDPAQLQMVFDALQNEPADDAAKKDQASGSPACDSEAEAPAPATAASGRRKKRSLEQLIAALPVREVFVDPPEVTAEPAAWSCIGEERTKLIDYLPGRFESEHIVRRKYVRKDARHLPPIIAPLLTLQERCIATPRLLAHMLSSRFELHLPYYRIEQMCARLGLPLSRQTLCGWAGMAHEASALVIERIKREVFQGGYVQCDETPVKYQDPEREGGTGTGTGYLWVFYNPVRDACLFVWSTSRSAATLESIVPQSFEGIMQSDGYSAYDSFIKQPARAGKIKLAGCMAHMRRKFFEAQAEGADPQWVLAQVQQLYQIEARQRAARASPAATLEERRRSSAAIMERIKARLEYLQASHKHLPRSLSGEALSYALNQWDKLGEFLRDGRVQIDNNLVENTIRPSAIGKKNWLFMGDATTGERAATFYTLIGNAHREGINAESYLTELFQTSARRNQQDRAPAHAQSLGRRASRAQANARPKRDGRSVEQPSVKRPAMVLRLTDTLKPRSV